MQTQPMPQKCQHHGCQCSVPEGQAYCSEHCRNAAQQASKDQAPHQHCECGHDQCRTARESPQRAAS